MNNEPREPNLSSLFTTFPNKKQEQNFPADVQLLHTWPLSIRFTDHSRKRKRSNNCLWMSMINIDIHLYEKVRFLHMSVCWLPSLFIRISFTLLSFFPALTLRLMSFVLFIHFISFYLSFLFFLLTLSSYSSPNLITRNIKFLKSTETSCNNYTIVDDTEEYRMTPGEQYMF